MVIANKADAMVVIGERTRERDAARAENERLRHDTELGLSEGPHSDPTDCPTFYDYCHCTVVNLIHNIERAEKAEAENEQLQEIINAVEWVADYGHTLVCPWCGRTRDAGHSEGCIRHAAHEDQCSP